MKPSPGNNTQPPPAWVTSSYSNGAGGECLECGAGGDRIWLRDSKVGADVVASVSPEAWHTFTRAVRQGWSENR
ncbi:DUF397 domain-containing protein [Streptomyces sp. SBST2-5]|uniref:DUF397 domain-containing protein n=3 Tax=Streptomyces TaxID=1883 RepID=A0ABN1YHT6_9ACTN|nr:DUF397 domain-containing protein [Streptomyces composti]NJP50700.1 DUF397 domain-containing protein [Streptomyces composti]